MSLSDQEPAESCATCVCAIWVNKITGPQGAEILQGYCRFNPPYVVGALRNGPTAPKIMGAPPPPPNVELVPSYALTQSNQWCAQHMTAEDYSQWKAARLGFRVELGDFEEEAEAPAA